MAEDINGIMYWINDTEVYHPDDIRNNVENPRVIAHYKRTKRMNTKLLEKFINVTPEYNQINNLIISGKIFSHSLDCFSSWHKTLGPHSTF